MSDSLLLRILIAILIALPRISAFAQAPPATLLDLRTIGDLGSQLFTDSGSTGMVLVIVRGNQVFFRGYGETAPNSRQLPTKSLFTIS